MQKQVLSCYTLFRIISKIVTHAAHPFLVGDIFHPDFSNGRPMIFLCVTRSFLATSPLLLLEQLVCAEKLIKMLSTFLRWRGQVQSLYLWSLMLWGFGHLSPGRFSSELPAKPSYLTISLPLRPWNTWFRDYLLHSEFWCRGWPPWEFKL